MSGVFPCAQGFRSLKEEEEVEFEISDNGGKSKAINVTGPAGAFVQGAPRRARGTFYDTTYAHTFVCGSLREDINMVYLIPFLSPLPHALVFLVPSVSVALLVCSM